MEAKLHVGELYFGQMDKDSTLAPAARSVFERIRDNYPKDWRAYWFLGAIGSVMRDDSLTVRNFRKVTELADATRAKRYATLTYDKVLQDRLNVMDATAIVMCRENNLPLVVFNLNNPGDLVRVVMGEAVGTSVMNHLPRTGTGK